MTVKCKMNNNRIASIANYLSAVLLFFFGVVYGIKSSFMPYHAEALGCGWEEIDGSTQLLILALMRCVAGGYLAVSVGVAVMQCLFNRYKIKSLAWLIFVSGWIITGFSVYATVLVRIYTPGKPPTALAIFGLLLFVVGLFFNLKGLRANDSQKS